MKRFLSLALALIMVFSTAAFAFAADVTIHECEVCGKKYTSVTGLNECLEFHETHTEYVCVCGKRYTDEAAYRACMTEHEEEVEEGYTAKTCEACGVVLISEEAYELHHNDGGCLIMFATCPYCSEKVLTEDYATKDENGNLLDIEYHTHTCPKANKGCDYCGDTFASEADYDEHIDKCKADHFNIPVAKIIDVIKNLPWDDIFAKVKDVFGQIGTALGDLDIEGLLGDLKLDELFGELESAIGGLTEGK